MESPSRRAVAASSVSPLSALSSPLPSESTTTAAADGLTLTPVYFSAICDVCPSNATRAVKSTSPALVYVAHELSSLLSYHYQQQTTHSIVFESIVFESIVFESIVFERIVFERIVFERIVFERIVFERIVFESM